MKCHYCGVDHADELVRCPECGRDRVPANSETVPPTRVVPGTGFNRDATRYLCAALQMNASLNHQAHKKILKAHYRAIASSPGVDLVTVLKYGVAARSRQMIRDVVLVALLVIGLVLLASPESEWVLLALFSGWAVLLVETLSTQYGVLAKRLRRDVFDPALAPAPGSGAIRARLDAIELQNRGNVTVSAQYGPFSGYGDSFGNWSFTLNVAKPAEGCTDVIDFTTGELRDHIADAVREIGLPGLVVEDRVFVSGLDLLHGLDPAVKRAVLPNELAAPAARVDEDVIARMREDATSRARPYLVIRVGGWSGDLVVTLFLRFSLLPRGDQLHVEANYSLLRPIHDRYQQVDRLLDAPTPLQLARATRSCLLRFVPVAFGAVARLSSVVLAPLEDALGRMREARAIKHGRSFNYGAEICLRELAAEKWYHRYFQALDKEMYSKVVERRVVDALEEFLDERDIDTRDLRERQTTILNNGVYVSGQGSLTAGSLAVGTNPIAKVVSRAGSTFTRPRSAPAGRGK
ncbi:hypothetical protein REH65_08350 [Saccharopolyspora sp. ID03-671]|uniref:hypothetical protein n=1 Tax=Saccharopolyspora sp. ID03-671 TaxID=3073066 RepID=UPI0032501C8B